MPPRGQSTPEQVANAERLLGEFFDEVLQEFQVEPGRAALLGFSQGGGMTYRCGLAATGHVCRPGGPQRNFPRA